MNIIETAKAPGAIGPYSQGYTAKASALGGIESIKENAPAAEVVLLD